MGNDQASTGGTRINRLWLVGVLGGALTATGSLAADMKVALPELALQPFSEVPAVIAGPELPAAPMEPRAPSLTDCANAAALLQDLRIRLTGEQQAQLNERRFLLMPLESTALAEPLPANDEEEEWAFASDEMLMAFAILGGGPDPLSRRPSNSRLITPDLVLHAWHRGVTRALEYVEERRLHEALETLLNGALQNVREMRELSKGATAARLAWAEARFAAPWILLGPPAAADEPVFVDGEAPRVDGKTYDQIVKARLQEATRDLPEEVMAALTAEIDLVMAADAVTVSPLFGRYAPDKPTDYTQFKPRSHYTRSNTLGGYFRSLMFLGRQGYAFAGNKEAYGDALLAVLAMARQPGGKGEAPLQAWKTIMEVTGFFAGQSDDLAYPDLRQWMAQTLGSASLTPASAVSSQTAGELAAALGKLRRPRIVSQVHAEEVTAPEADPPAFYIFGQRFGWDARILDRLTRGAPEAMPSLPSAVLIPALFGDAFAERIARRAWDSQPLYLASFETRLPEIRAELAAVPEPEWFSSVAAKQLHVLTRLGQPRNENFPAFMRSDLFLAKNLESQLGSYTELKHDTVLYAKQVYAEAGEGGDADKAPPAAKGLVQPDTGFWREMERMAVFVAEGMQRHRLLPDAAEEFSRFRVFARQMAQLRVLAEKHVTGAPLSDEDWELIRTVDFSEMAKPFRPYDQPNPGDGKCALVTDILTDAAGGAILFEALGRPLVMLALVGGADGNRMVAGLAYDHREFSRSLSEGRMTDAEWQAGIYQEKPQSPSRSSWQVPVCQPEKVPVTEN